MERFSLLPFYIKDLTKLIGWTSESIHYTTASINELTSDIIQSLLGNFRCASKLFGSTRSSMNFLFRLRKNWQYSPRPVKGQLIMQIWIISKYKNVNKSIYGCLVSNSFSHLRTCVPNIFPLPRKLQRKRRLSVNLTFLFKSHGNLNSLQWWPSITLH